MEITPDLEEFVFPTVIIWSAWRNDSLHVQSAQIYPTPFTHTFELKEREEDTRGGRHIETPTNNLKRIVKGPYIMVKLEGGDIHNS